MPGRTRRSVNLKIRKSQNIYDGSIFRHVRQPSSDRVLTPTPGRGRTSYRSQIRRAIGRHFRAFCLGEPAHNEWHKMDVQSQTDGVPRKKTDFNSDEILCFLFFCMFSHVLIDQFSTF